MPKRLTAVLAALLLLPALAQAQDARTVLADVAQAMGGANLRSIEFSASGEHFQLGQSAYPGAPWPRFIVKSFCRAINYDTASMQDEIVRLQGENSARGGGQQPILGEQRQNFFVSGHLAWNRAGEAPVPAPLALVDRQVQLWTSPHGVVRAALASGASVESRMEGGRRVTAIAFAPPNG